MTQAQSSVKELDRLLDHVSSTCSEFKGQQSALQRNLADDRSDADQIQRFLQVSDRVTTALEALNEEVFRDEINTVQRLLTHALQDVLDQPISLKAEISWKNKAAAVTFFVERDGNFEHILRGQGGSVANILSVGLRIFALQSLGDDHRKFLVLDEQDCWLRPDRVPQLMKLIRQAAKDLNFQMIVISHHDKQLFESHADRVFEFQPQRGGAVLVKGIDPEPKVPDQP